MKYYLYISDVKVDMLFPQVPPEFVRGSEAEFKVNFGVFSGGVKARAPDEAKDMVRRTEIVTSYVRKHHTVGTVETPADWISDSASVRFGVVKEYAADIAFFGEVIGNKKFALLGSSASMIGGVKISDANHDPFYYTLKFLNGWLESQQVVTDSQPYSTYSDAFDLAFAAVPVTRTRIEFLARVLYSSPVMLIASPVYVAISDSASAVAHERVDTQGSKWRRIWKRTMRIRSEE